MSSEEEENFSGASTSTSTRSFPIVHNSDGAPVAFGTQTQDLLYCGRDLGIGSDNGKCGPRNGPQCPACQRLQSDPRKRWELMSLLFPSLSPDLHFVAALRQSHGSWTKAADWLRALGAPHVPANVAFPPHNAPNNNNDQQGGGPPPVPVDSALICRVLEVVPTVDPNAAQTALRRSNHNVDAAVAYIFDTPGEELEAAVAQDEQRTMTHQVAQMERLAERRLVYAQTEAQDLPPAVQNLQYESASQEEAPTAGALGHAMTSEEKEPVLCVICATPASSSCSNCKLCEGCVHAKVVFRCPKMRNGAHVHHHPLTLVETRRRNRTCSVAGEGCQGSNGLAWYCQECDRFDVCGACMAKDIPQGHHRRFGRRTMMETTTAEAQDEPVDEEEEEEDSGSESEEEDDEEIDNRRRMIPSNYDGVAAERFAASVWEGSLPEPPMGEVLVGTGLVGTTNPPTQRRTNPQSSTSTATNRRASGTESTALAKESQSALEMLMANAKITTACDAQLMEELLHRAEKMGADYKTLKMLRESVAAGNFAIAGALVLAKDYAPKENNNNKRKRGEDANDNSNGEEDVERCFCGDAIDARGAVGCLHGHSMHPDCASDLMLGGGHCPTCRDPLFFPRVPAPEAKLARQNAAAEVRRLQQEEETKMKAETQEQLSKGIYNFLTVGDIVRISSDQKLCVKEMMKHPGRTGWCSDLADSCGLVGKITEVAVTHGFGEDSGHVLAVRVRTKALGHLFGQGDNGFRCRKCRQRVTANASNNNTCAQCIHCQACKACCEADESCVNSFHEWYWTPSLLTLVARSSGAALFDPSLASKDVVTATEAEHHILRLRAELKAVGAGRAVVKEELEKAWLEMKEENEVSGVSSKSLEALRAVAKDLTPADRQRARHLLALAHQWEDSKEVLAKRELLEETVRAGDIDSAARFVRRHNASLVADSLRWADATTTNCEYLVESFCEVELLAWPSTNAPKTGYKLKPKTRFVSKQEWLDKSGALWLQVDEKSFVDLGSDSGVVVSDAPDRKTAAALMGASVIRGPDWNYGNQDGGEGSVGIVSLVESGTVKVHWKGIQSTRSYRAGADGKFDLIFSNMPPPPQGWLCTHPGGLGSPVVVARRRSDLRCFGCGDGLLPPSAMPKQGFRVVKKEDKLSQGDALLVAATLEPVQVVSVAGGKICCSFSGMAGDICLPVGANFTISYNPQDLVYPKAEEGIASYDEDGDVVMVENQPRSRRDLVLIHGNETDARNAWAKGKESATGSGGAESDGMGASFPSCPKGHLLHARCFQGALLSGQCCPAKDCDEPLWQPRVRLLRSDGATCCGRTPSTDEGEVALSSANELDGHSADVRAGNGTAVADANTIESARVAGELKMCPCCFSGPVFNNDCEDMSAHQGQCSVAAVGGRSCGFSASASDIASSLARMSGTMTVADVLPKCPEHKVVVMFNGCMSCGHLFTDTDWNDMPKWDPNAKVMLKLDKKKREAASILAKEIRRESGMLQYERDALRLALTQGSEKGQSDCMLKCLPSLPPPAEDFVQVGCGPHCDRSHSGQGNCLLCGRTWGSHNGHICSDGRRGEWMLP